MTGARPVAGALRLRTRPGLRLRIALGFAVTSLVVTGALSVATWTLTAGFLTERRTETASTRAEVDAVLVGNALRDRAVAVGPILEGLAAAPGTSVLLRRDGVWSVTGAPDDPRTLPATLTATPARADSAILLRGGGRVLAVSAPVPGGALLVESGPLTELDATAAFLGWLLAGGTAVAGLLGLLLGRWAAARALRPVGELSGAAARVAAGDLAQRLPDTRDRDLAPLTATFNRTVAALAHRVARDQRFTGDVSHELRSPLTTLVAASDVLRRRRDEMPETARQAVDLLDTDLRRLSGLVGDLLEISREEEPTREEDLEEVDLAELSAAVAREGPPTPATGTLEVTSAAPVLGDRRRLRQVLVNLLRNAEAHGGGAVRVGVSSDGASARWEVDDAGPGVDTAHRERIFERLDRGGLAGDRRATGGSGLGLAVVRGHVRRHHGTVAVTDRPGGGARFVVEIPLATGTRT